MNKTVSREVLLSQLMQNLQSMYRGVLHKSNFPKDAIPFGQKAALFTIALHRTMNIKQLANTLHVTSGAATQHVEALVMAGLVQRSPDVHDRRNVTIVLSAQGKVLIKKLEQQRTVMFESLLSEVSDDELVAYNTVMEKINNKLYNQEMVQDA